MMAHCPDCEYEYEAINTPHNCPDCDRPLSLEQAIIELTDEIAEL